MAWFCSNVSCSFYTALHCSFCDRQAINQSINIRLLGHDKTQFNVDNDSSGEGVSSVLCQEIGYEQRLHVSPTRHRIGHVAVFKMTYFVSTGTLNLILIRMWANAQRDGRLAEYRWRPLLNAAKFG